MSSLDNKSALEVYDWYEDIERRIDEILRVMPFFNLDQARSMASPRLASILMESASLIDTLLRDQMPLEFERGKAGKSFDKKLANIVDYRKHLEPKLELSEKRSILLVGEPVLLRPFEQWSKNDSEHSPNWWKSYNAIKHNRLAAAGTVSMMDCILSICALNQVMMSIPETLKLVFRMGWSDCTKYNPQIAITELIEPKQFGFMAYTRYFATFLFPVDFESYEDVRPIGVHNGERLEAHLGRLGTTRECISSPAK